MTTNSENEAILTCAENVLLNNMKDFAFLLPAFNEERSIGKLLDNIDYLFPSSQVVVIDNNSNDLTSNIVEKKGITVIHEEKQGKGHAVKTGFTEIMSSANQPKYVLMMDSDNTYDPRDASLILEPLINNRADVVLGSRMNCRREKGSISKFNIIGNRILSFIATIFHNHTSDVCTGYWGFKREVIEHLLERGLESEGFELEVEMFVKISRANFRIKEQPIFYKRRLDRSKLNSVKDGLKIFKTLCFFSFRTPGNIKDRNK